MKQEINLENLVPGIAVMGVGGAGGNAIDNMIRSNLTGISFFVCNTDAQALSQSLCQENDRIRMGFDITQGLGAGARPELGQAAAQESIDDIMNKLDGINMLFVTAGMGGGTGTGAAPVIAEAAREKGILTIGVVSKPFLFEGTGRMATAEKGIKAMRDAVDTLLVIPNQNLFRVADQNTTFDHAFAMADEVLISGVKTLTDLMLRPGRVNCDYADICTVMRNTQGRAMMGCGTASGESKAIKAAEEAIGGLLLDHPSLSGAKSILINVTGGTDLLFYDVDAAVSRIKKELTQDANGQDAAHIIFGSSLDKDMEGSIRVSVVATGLNDAGYPVSETKATPETGAPVLNEPIPIDSLRAMHTADQTAYDEPGGIGGSYSQDAAHSHDTHMTMGTRHNDTFFSGMDTPSPSMQDVLKEEPKGPHSFAFEQSFSQGGASQNTPPQSTPKAWKKIKSWFKGNDIPTIMPMVNNRVDNAARHKGPVKENNPNDLPPFLNTSSGA